MWQILFSWKVAPHWKMFCELRGMADVVMIEPGQGGSIVTLGLESLPWVKHRDNHLGGGFKDFLFSPLLGEMIPFWLICFNWVAQPPTSDASVENGAMIVTCQVAVRWWTSSLLIRLNLEVEVCTRHTLQGTNISPQNGILKIFLFPRWDMFIPWRVLARVTQKLPESLN